MDKIRVGVVGAAGYTGGELIRLLLNHPAVTLQWAQSRSSAGRPLSELHPDLLGETNLEFVSQITDETHVVFLCLPHGESEGYLNSHHLRGNPKVIDLSADFRLNRRDGFVYGLPELNREEIKQAGKVANPGCFATALQLAVLPLVSEGYKGDFFATGITGSTGAGIAHTDTSHFSWRHSNIQAYKVLSHQHIAEVSQSIAQIQPSYQGSFRFVPWRGDFARGIYVSVCVPDVPDIAKTVGLYRTFYASHPFVHFSETTVDMKRVVNTNKCLLSVSRQGNDLVVHAAIDNLIKGAAGQAIQNMNLMFEQPETAGLKLKSIAF